MGCATAMPSHTLVEEGPAAIQQLIEWGAEFDREGAKLSFTREGAHSRNRILHAHGDSTGREIARTLYQQSCLAAARSSSAAFAATTDLLLDDGGSRARWSMTKPRGSSTSDVRARRAAGDGRAGPRFLETTNPDVATGDGVAMAWRAGAEISDIEFVQFHPTALSRGGRAAFPAFRSAARRRRLPAQRGGRAFMERYHPLQELAPRDVVSRAIVAEMARTGAPHVLLDLTHREPDLSRRRFPRVYETCLRYGVDMATQPAPVHPAAHYAMGGVRTDLDGRTSLTALYRRRGSGVHGCSRGQPAGQQFAARGRGVRRARRRRDADVGGVAAPGTRDAPR